MCSSDLMLDDMRMPVDARACREAVDMINHQPERLARRDILEDAGFEYQGVRKGTVSKMEQVERGGDRDA